MLRIGIMCRGDTFHAWEASVIQSLMDFDDISIDLLIQEDLEPKGIFSWIKKISWKHIIWQIFFRISSRSMTCDLKVDLSKELSGTDKIKCKPELKGKYSQYFKPEDIDIIQNYNLDIVLRFGFNIIRGDILSSAKYGVWSYHHGDNNLYRGMPSGFWEIYLDDPKTGSVLQQLTDVLDGGKILKRGSFATVKYSYAKNRNMIHEASSIWVAKLCREILDRSLNPTDLVDQSTNENCPDEPVPIYSLPGNFQMIRFIYLQSLNLIKRRIINSIYRPNWKIGIANLKKDDVFDIKKLKDVKWIPQSKSSFKADSFLIKVVDTYYIFFEEYLFSEFRGRISYVKSKDLESFSTPELVLNDSFHLSYPYVFEHEGEIYMLPEQAESGKIALYVSDKFPGNWRMLKTIADFPGLDPTVFFKDGRWWLFAGRDSINGTENSTYLSSVS